MLLIQKSVLAMLVRCSAFLCQNIARWIIRLFKRSKILVNKEA